MKWEHVPERCPRCYGAGYLHRISGAWLRRVRTARGVTLRAVARRVGVSATFLSDVERGRRWINPDMCSRYLRAIREMTREAAP